MPPQDIQKKWSSHQQVDLQEEQNKKTHVATAVWFSTLILLFNVLVIF